MDKFPFLSRFKSIWNNLPLDSQKPLDIIYLVFLGLLVGFLTGSILAVFRITTNMAFTVVLAFGETPDKPLWVIVCWLLVCMVAAFLVGLMIRNPAIRFGGEAWIKDAEKEDQKSAWLKVLVPKFLGSWLVMACGISVGREGPCIQMGAAPALGLKNLDYQNSIERRYFVVAGCAAGLAGAFSAPFAGMCYVYEIMRESIDRTLFMFLLAGAFGVYISATRIFGLDVMMPLGASPMPDTVWLLVPLGIFAGLVGIIYNYLLRISKSVYAWQKIIPVFFQPMFAFCGAAIMVMVYPSICGEGLTIFASIESGHAFLDILVLFLALKLIFTAFCYGSSIPAGQMVPVICVGGVAGGLYADVLIGLGMLDPAFTVSFMIMGMGASFAASERAPLTAIVLVTEMTGAFSLGAGMLLVVAIAVFSARICRVRAV